METVISGLWRIGRNYKREKHRPMSSFQTKTQVSAGGVAYRMRKQTIEVVLISAGESSRWQLPKGLLKKDESREQAAVREVREETGIETTLIDLIDTIEYWYYTQSYGQRVRFHKFVHFYLLKYRSGTTKDHDTEVNEACWVNINKAYDMLTFKSERNTVGKAKAMIGAFQESSQGKSLRRLDLKGREKAREGVALTQ
jgi:8-oxo-dGTP pyrophosphatase MutT (NUDIX family)